MHFLLFLVLICSWLAPPVCDRTGTGVFKEWILSYGEIVGPYLTCIFLLFLVLIWPWIALPVCVHGTAWRFFCLSVRGICAGWGIQERSPDQCLQKQQHKNISARRICDFPYIDLLRLSAAKSCCHCSKWSEKENDNSTWCSQAVSHPSTNQAQRCLTSVIGRELVFSTWYGRCQESAAVCQLFVTLDHLLILIFFCLSRMCWLVSCSGLLIFQSKV